jgi:hypothetical protein
MRLANQKIESKIAKKIDKLLMTDFSEKELPNLTVRCGDGDLRRKWLDLYAKNNGTVVKLCNERVAPLISDPVIAQIADKAFYARYPKKAGRGLSLTVKDRSLRSEWMDLYVEYGGRVSVVCDFGKNECALANKSPEAGTAKKKK